MKQKGGKRRRREENVRENLATFSKFKSVEKEMLSNSAVVIYI